MGSDEVAPQDPSPPATWRESASDLSTRLSEDSGGRAATVAIEKACADILSRHFESSHSPADGGGDDGDDHSLPDSVRSVVTTVYLRALIKLGKYGVVVDHCRRHEGADDGGNNAEEVAYSLYRLRRYEACRRLCAAGGGSSDRGMMHVLAQALYRLGETNEADTVYRRLLAEGDDDGDGQAATKMDADEREDTLANALANRAANYTPGSLLSVAVNSWVEHDDTLRQLLESYGNDDGGDGELLQNYDLAYNLATYLLVSFDARDSSSILEAKRLLEHAEASALTILEPSAEDEDGGGSEGATAKEEEALGKKHAQQQQLAEREAGPIRANLALAKLLLGGEENETEALRGYLTLVTKAAKSKGDKGAGQANLVAAASNNLAMLRDGKESVFDVIKRVPTTSSLSVSEDNAGSLGKGGKRKGGKEKGEGGTSTLSASTVALAGATPQQARVALFNRALLFAKMGNTAVCLEALGMLRASLLASYHGDDNKDSGDKEKGGGGAGLSPKRAGGKKKKGVTGVCVGNAGTRDVPTAKPASWAEGVAWSARADFLESELRRSSPDGKSSEDIVNDAITKLDIALKQPNAGDEVSGALVFAKSQLLLHRAVANNPEGLKATFIEALESLPPPVRFCPGTTVMLASLHASSNNDAGAEDLMSSLGDDAPSRLALAEFLVERGRHKDAVELLRGIIEEDASTEAKAFLVKALSYIDPSGAEEHVGLLQEAMGAGGGRKELDGEALESMEIPRFAKKALGGGGGVEGGGFSKVRKMITATGGSKRGSNPGEQKKKNRESTLRKRAKRREAYLSRLQSEGRYDPTKTPLPKPDPERWIPKSQRSYNRRGRGGRGRHKSNVGAQGGGTGAGMERDAARLDVAARVAEAKSGDGGSGKPSTANIKVSSSGKSRKGKGGRRR
mmetsp:Transcript_46350/g.98295  ORF Transcript_46350/g.98295 Transcript_46350/m.98295 type:complete len:910 (+) Transcript_46350:81-2810(+)